MLSLFNLNGLAYFCMHLVDLFFELSSLVLLNIRCVGSKLLFLLFIGELQFRCELQVLGNRESRLRHQRALK